MFSLFLFLLSSLGCLVAANVIPKVRPNQIYDVIHDNLPLFELEYSSDILIALQLLFTLLIMSTNEDDLFFTSMAYIQGFRILCCVSTVLPPLKSYKDKYRMGGINGSGTEYIFSGHASFSCLSFLILWSKDILPLYALILYNIVSQSLIVLTRNHYTVDVILAWIISTQTKMLIFKDV